ncbi:Unannotated [Lentimonas sp. CC4]|nr:Unannotated [Lentimonas sp. CC4]CAA6684183.1 Unannotated [Lentimonas sp. CC6]CAA7076444.1 Unannotated [Lentimonas sp. CC4]CAA7170381.1 Unannotated [Lentimonas sp. CC21]CAA7182846.1 Unannotated [Lentimonas sp. CC8]
MSQGFFVDGFIALVDSTLGSMRGSRFLLSLLRRASYRKLCATTSNEACITTAIPLIVVEAGFCVSLLGNDTGPKKIPTCSRWGLVGNTYLK